jgi:hypothetical protein
MTERIQAECHGLVNLSREHGKWEAWIAAYEKTLAGIERDYSIMTSPSPDKAFRIIPAVDFYDLYQYVFPFRDLIRRSGVDWRVEAKRRGLAVQHIARAFLLHDAFEADRIYILPPHVQELSYSLLADTTAQASSGVIDGDAVRLRQELRDLRTTMSTLCDKTPVHTGAFELMRTNYENLLYLLAAMCAGSRDLLDDVLARLSIPEPRSPILARQVNKAVYSDWYAALSHSRSGRFVMATARDAEALEMVCRANAACERTRELYVLVSSAPVMERAAVRVGAASQVVLRDGTAFPILRDLSYFTALVRLGPSRRAAVPQGDPAETRKWVLSAVQAEQEAIKRYKEISHLNRIALASCPDARAVRSRSSDVAPEGPPCSHCILDPLKSRLSTSLLQITQIQREIEDAEFLLQSKPYLERFSRSVLKGATDLEREVLELIEDSTFEERAREVADGLRTQLMARLIGFHAQVEAFKGHIEADQLELLSLFPFRVGVANKALDAVLAKAAVEIRSAAAAGKTTQCEKALERLMSSSLRLGRAYLDVELVECIVLVALGRYELARTLARICKVRTGPRKGNHFAYLELLATILDRDAAGTSEELLVRVRAGMEEHAHDARFCLLYSYAGLRVAKPETNSGFLDELIGCMLAALSAKRGWDELKAALCNNLAYALALKGTAPALDRADGFMDRIKRYYASGEDDWRSHWLDTLAFIALQRARAATTPEDRRTFAQKALRLYLRAAEKALGPRRQKAIRDRQTEALVVLLAPNRKRESTTKL